MEILNNTPLKTLKRMTPLQLEILEQAGIKTLGELICITPRRIDEILPWTDNIITNIKYQHIFEIVSLIHKKSSRGLAYVLVQLKSDNKFYQGFLFSRANFILNKLKLGEKYQMTVSLFSSSNTGSGSNLIIQKIKPIESKQVAEVGFNSSFEVFYPKLSSKIDSTFLRRVFQRLKSEDFIIDLRGLTPFELFNSHKLDISYIHKPSNMDQFFKTQQNLQILKVFLKTALQKYIVFQTTKTNLALAPKLDLEWMKESVLKLSVVLTQSQKSAIWEILQDITSV